MNEEVKIVVEGMFAFEKCQPEKPDDFENANRKGNDE